MQAGVGGRTLDPWPIEADLRTGLADLASGVLAQKLGTDYPPVTFGDGGPLPGVDVTNNAALRDIMDQA